MQITEPRVEVDKINPDFILKCLEFRGRRCYKSEDMITGVSAPLFVQGIVDRGHTSVIEHEKISANFVVDRGISHELVRHRIASPSQESTRYCNYGKTGGVTFIRPYWEIPGTEDFNLFSDDCAESEVRYLRRLNRGQTPQQARGALIHNAKTEVEFTFNFRSWRNFFQQRAAATAHPQMRQAAIPLLLHFQQLLPPIFGDIPYDASFDPANYAQIVVRDLAAMFAAPNRPPIDWDEFLNQQTDVHVRKVHDYKSRFMRKLVSCETTLEAHAVWKWEVEKKLDRVRTWIDEGELAVQGEGVSNAVGDAFNYTVQYMIWANGQNWGYDPLQRLGEKDFYDQATKLQPSKWIDFWSQKDLIGPCEMPEMRPVLLEYMGVKQK